jgi:hypothetical protein
MTIWKKGRPFTGRISYFLVFFAFDLAFAFAFAIDNDFLHDY